MPSFRITIPDGDPSQPMLNAAYLRGWWAGALADAWPAPPRGLGVLLEAQWDRGAFAGSVSRILARRMRMG